MYLAGHISTGKYHTATEPRPSGVLRDFSLHKVLNGVADTAAAEKSKQRISLMKKLLPTFTPFLVVVSFRDHVELGVCAVRKKENTLNRGYSMYTPFVSLS